MEDFERRLEEWRREDLQDRRREALWNAIVNMIVAVAALIAWVPQHAVAGWLPTALLLDGLDDGRTEREFVVVVALGTLVIFTFDPCPAGAAASDLPSFCTAR